MMAKLNAKSGNIIEIAMNREGYDISNSELSMIDYMIDELEKNIEHDMEISTNDHSKN